MPSPLSTKLRTVLVVAGVVIVAKWLARRIADESERTNDGKPTSLSHTLHTLGGRHHRTSS